MPPSESATSHAGEIHTAVQNAQKGKDASHTKETGAIPATASSTSNGLPPSKGAFDESNISSEVDRILNSINVNGFIKNGTSLPSNPAETQAPTEALHAQTEQPPKTNGTTPQVKDIPPITSILSSWISTAKPSLLTSALRTQLQECILDFIAVTASGATIAPSSEPILKGLLNFTHSQSLPTAKGCTVATRGQSHPPHYAALLNATYGHSLDFDDTHAVSSLHAGVTAIATALAEAEHQLRNNTSTLTSDDILLAILLGYETTIRIGVALSTSSYSRGFHNTSTAGIFGAVAVLSSLRHLTPECISNAFGLAGSKAAGSMQYLANGSHNKRLHPGFAAHDAFLCVSLAEAGVIGADKIIEGDLGLLQAYTDRDRHAVDYERLTSDLGNRWEFTDSALKPYAGCRMTHSFIELADSLGSSLRDGKWSDKGASGIQSIKKIRCTMPKANMILVGQPLPNKIHPENIVDAQFSAYYQVANAVVYGGTHDMAAYDRLKDQAVREMCDKIECVVDEGMKGMSGRMDVFLVDENGEVVEVVRREMGEPLGERSHPFVREKVNEKFMGLMGPVYGEERSGEIMGVIDNIGKEGEEGSLLKLMDLVAEPEK
ncbi:hypothetical protein OHC33_009744 [Knufia fluminis]|uniref:Uncharacterized protein n=1 Tax=Knufia fluminis TaxID=191047 RepID=A0AAN8E9L9_9EURO|nr:hypothetical protein OHC33_009744 [Knufia fluminis]